MNLREWALPVYTILIQLATGALVALWVIRSRFAKLGGKELDRLTRVPILILFSTTGIAIVGAHFHLSKPFLSFLAMTNFAHSWLSREIIATVLFLFSMGALAALVWFTDGRYALKAALGWITVFLGLATILCMAQVYLLPTQIAWNSTVTTLSYYGEAALLGATSLSAILLMDLNFMYEQGSETIQDHDRVVAAAIKGLIFASVIAMIANLALNAEQILFLSALQNESAQMSMRLLSDLYQPLYLVRLGMTVIGVSWLLVSYFRISKIKGQIQRLIIHAYIASTLVLIGEVLGRFLFYAIHVRSGI